MKYLSLVFFAIVLLGSCQDNDNTPQKRTTKFTSEAIYIGMQKKLVIEAFGEPFNMDSYSVDSKRIDILYYKEIVDIDAYPHILTTILYFGNGDLETINQESERARSASLANSYTIIGL
jgi:hypothetical protein